MHLFDIPAGSVILGDNPLRWREIALRVLITQRLSRTNRD